MILYALILFLTGVFTDIVWALYIRKVAEGKKLQGAFYSVATGIFAAVIIKGIIINSWPIFPWLFGLFVGTYFAIDVEDFFKKLLYGKNKNE